MYKTKEALVDKAAVALSKLLADTPLSNTGINEFIINSFVEANQKQLENEMAVEDTLGLHIDKCAVICHVIGCNSYEVINFVLVMAGDGDRWYDFIVRLGFSMNAV